MLSGEFCDRCMIKCTDRWVIYYISYQMDSNEGLQHMLNLGKKTPWIVFRYLYAIGMRWQNAFCIIPIKPSRMLYFTKGGIIKSLNCPLLKIAHREDIVLKCCKPTTAQIPLLNSVKVNGYTDRGSNSSWFCLSFQLDQLIRDRICSSRSKSFINSRSHFYDLHYPKKQTRIHAC